MRRRRFAKYSKRKNQRPDPLSSHGVFCVPKSAELRAGETYALDGPDYGGEGGIRTPGARKGSLAFEASAIDHSATSPYCFSTTYLVVRKRPECQMSISAQVPLYVEEVQAHRAAPEQLSALIENNALSFRSSNAGVAKKGPVNHISFATSIAFSGTKIDQRTGQASKLIPASPLSVLPVSQADR